MMRKSIAAVLCALLLCLAFSSCSIDGFPPESEKEGNIPTPVFISDSNTRSRAIGIDVDVTGSNVRNEEGRFMYYTQFPLISSFIMNDAVSGEDISTEIATERLTLSTTQNGPIVTYEGQNESYYIYIELDTENNLFDYRQIALADVNLKQDNASEPFFIQFALITEGNDLSIHEDGGIDGSVESLYFRKSDSEQSENKIAVEKLTEEMYSDSNTHAIALVGLSSMSDTSQFTALPSLEEAKDMAISSFGLTEGNPPLILYYHNEEGFNNINPAADSSDLTDDEKLEFIRTEGSKLFDGKWVF